MKALVEKDILMKKQEQEMRKAPHSFYVNLSRELKGTRGNPRVLQALVEVLEGKNSGKGANRENFTNEEEEKRENIEVQYEHLRRLIKTHLMNIKDFLIGKHRRAIRTYKLKNVILIFILDYLQ